MKQSQTTQTITPVECSIPNPSLIAMCQGEGQCCNVGPYRHFIYSTKVDDYGTQARSCELYCEKCCPACRAKKEIEHGPQ